MWRSVSWQLSVKISTFTFHKVKNKSHFTSVLLHTADRSIKETKVEPQQEATSFSCHHLQVTEQQKETVKEGRGQKAVHCEDSSLVSIASDGRSVRFLFRPPGGSSPSRVCARYLISELFWVIDLLHGDGCGSESVAQLSENDSVSQRLLQLSGSRKLLPQTRLHPPEKTNRKSDVICGVL